MYVSRNQNEIDEMLRAIGVESVEELLQQVPDELRRADPLDLPPPLSEMELASHVKGLAAADAGAALKGPFLGGGAYDHYAPAAVRSLTSRAEFLTAYTPYQPEVSQGTLQGVFEYQSMACALTGMEVSNASLYDGASAAAEAALMARSITGRPDVVVSGTVRPSYRRVISTYLRYVGSEVKTTGMRGGRTEAKSLKESLSGDTAALVVQSPNMFGVVEDVAPAVEAARGAGALVIMICDLASLAVLKSPGEYGADIAVGEGQPAGAPLNYGGPYLGFMATRSSYIRKMPGRIVAEAADAEGRRGYVMTLQTREQHIRRERATSNICTNQGLVAMAAAVHVGLMGPAGLRRVAEACVRNAWYAAERLSSVEGFNLAFEGPFFREFPVRTPLPPADLNEALFQRGILGGLDLESWDASLGGLWMICVTEKLGTSQIDKLVKAVEEVCA